MSPAPSTPTPSAVAAGTLYPPTTPFAVLHLPVSGGHALYVEQCGNPSGKPVVVLHGGPGGGCSPGMRRYFDPAAYRIILFDQRGCGRSTPRASIECNTTWDLVRDIEDIRRRLDLDRWMVFGGSWGACLGLIYAQTHPERVSELVLRGVFTMRQSELDWFYGGGAGAFWPELWEKFVAPIPEEERGDLIGAYYARLTGEDHALRARLARIWSQWEGATASLLVEERRVGAFGDGALAFARIESHYFHHHGFLEADDQILRDAGRLAGIPGVIAQGRYDMICPPVTAHELHRRWPDSRLEMAPASGHAMSEPGLSEVLVRATNGFRGA